MECKKIKKTTISFIKDCKHFCISDGLNCLALVLYAITGDEKYLNKWVESFDFLKALKRKNYKEINEQNLMLNDVLTFWLNDELVHAAFVVSDTLVVNKNGQQKYNPITISSIETIKQNWNECKLRIFSRY